MARTSFQHSLIKGKIAEVVFAQMLQEAKSFTVLPFGYEYIVPEVLRMKKDKKSSKTLDILKASPDFVVINHLTKKVHLIEVKYRKKVSPFELRTISNKMLDSWNPSYLFLATPEGFFFDSAEVIIKNKGKIEPLNHPHLPDKLQAKYLELLNTFEQDN